jgi:hypothetical protein
MIASPSCPEYSSLCHRVVTSIRLEQMQCLDGSWCGAVPIPPCCNDIGIVELVVRCGGDTGCIKYYSNTSPIFAWSADAADTLSSSSAAFDWGAAEVGFRDSFDIFIMIFAVFVIVKMLNMAVK